MRLSFLSMPLEIDSTILFFLAIANESFVADHLSIFL